MKNAGKTFILVHHTTPNPCFRLKGYASSSNRLDIAARVLRAAFCTAEDVRRDVRVYVYLADTGIVLGFSGKDKPCDERLAMRLIRERLCGGRYTEMKGPHGFTRLVDAEEPNIILHLREEGRDIGSLRLSGRAVIILGSQYDVPSELLRKLKVLAVSVGPASYLASHVVAFVLGVFDSAS